MKWHWSSYGYDLMLFQAYFPTARHIFLPLNASRSCRGPRWEEDAPRGSYVTRCHQQVYWGTPCGGRQKQNWALLQCLPCIKVSKLWTIISQHDYILFLILTFDGAPAIRKSVNVNEDLSINLYFQDVEVTKHDGMIIPKSLNDARCLTRVLDVVESFDKIPAFGKPEDKTGGILKLVLSLREDSTNPEMQDEERQDILTFLKEQVFLLLS